MKKFTTFLCFLLLSGMSVHAQKISNTYANGTEGNEFWFSLPVPFSEVSPDNNIKLYVTSKTTARCTVEIPGLGVRIVKNVHAGNRVIDFNLLSEMGILYEKDDNPSSALTEEETFSIGKGRGVHIMSDAPITVYVVLNFLYTSDSFIALPVSSLGKEYVVASYADVTGKIPNQHLMSQTVITVAFDNTLISYALGGSEGTQTVGGMKRGQIKTFKVNKGDVIAFANKKIEGVYGDLSGSRIMSNKPIAVVSGNQCAAIDVKNLSCDFIMEMELPVETWGKEYHVTPIAKRNNPSFIKVFAKNPGTNLYRDGDTVPFATLTSGIGVNNINYFEGRVINLGESPRPVIIRSDGPISVTQYNSSKTEDSVSSDPFQMVLTPMEQYQNEITFATPELSGVKGYKENFINLVLQADANGEIPNDVEIGYTLDSTAWQPLKTAFGPSASPFRMFPGDTIQLISKTIQLPYKGVFKIRAQKPLAAYAYGSDDFESYGHPASLLLNSIDVRDTLPPEVEITQTGIHFYNAAIHEPGAPQERSGLSRVFLDPKLSSNVKIHSAHYVPGDINATVSLEIIDVALDASAVVVAVDKAGNSSIQYFSTTGNRLKIFKPVFEVLMPNQYQRSQLWVINQSATDSVELTSHTMPTLPEYSLTDWPEFPFRIGPSDTLALNIDFSASKDGFYIDSIILTSSGTPYTIPLGVNVVTIAAGIEEDQGKEVGIFPNPVTGITRITLPNFTGNTVIVKIYDMLGNEVVNFPQNQLQQEFHFNSKEIANGRYYIHFTDGQRTSVQSFIIWN